MHICILNMPQEYYSPVCGGAVSTVIMETARELIARGHQVSVLTITNDDPVYEVGEVVPVAARTRESLSFLQRRWSDLHQRFQHWDWPYYEHFMRSYTRALRQLQTAPDVVIVHNDLAAPRFIKRALPQTRVIVWLHNENRTDPRNLAANRNVVDHYIAVSSYIRDWTIRQHSIPPAQITAVLNAVNPQTFFPRPDVDVPPALVKVLFASRIDRNKGPDLAADAVATLRAEGLPVSLTVAGGIWWYNHGHEMEDPFFRELRGKMERANANYLGHVTRDRIPALFRTHDIVCLLSRSHDPCPLVCLEALGSGCALLGSTRGGIPEVCGCTAGTGQEGGSGGGAMLVDPDNPVAGFLPRCWLEFPKRDGNGNGDGDGDGEDRGADPELAAAAAGIFAPTSQLK
ncbi:MAG: glycosyltransferase family 4 protein [Phycisphaerae bacterium]